MYKISKEQMEKIAQVLSDCPLKYSLPVIDLLREIAANQKVEEEKKDA